MSGQISDITGEPIEFVFGGASYSNATDMLRSVARTYLASYDAETAFEEATNEELTTELLGVYGMQDSQDLHVWGPADLTAAFAAYRAEVATWDRVAA